MSFEVELKARLANPAAIEAKAAELGEFVKETYNWTLYIFKKKIG